MTSARGARSVIRCAILLLIGLAVPAAAQDEGYRLAEGDQLRLIVPGAPDFAGLYRLGERGRIALPLEGLVELSGMTVEEAAAVIRSALSHEMQHPSLGVEIAERRPFFIMGDVANSGSYPMEPGLTLGKALAVAGGTRRATGDELQEAVVSVRSNEEFGRSLFELAAARLRAARLGAEIEGETGFSVPQLPSGLDAGETKAVEAHERAIQEASQDAFESRMTLLERLLATRLDEIAALEARLKTIAEHSRRLDSDITEVEDLRARGLSTMDRVLSLTREKDRTQSDLLQTNVMLNQAREEQVQIEIEIDETPRQRRINLLNQLSDTKERIRHLEASVVASGELLEASAGSSAMRDAMQITFTITRGEQRLNNIADLGAPVRPGDLIEVRRNVATALIGQ